MITGDLIFEPGDVGYLIHNGNKISKLMAWFMGSKWSHSFLVLEQTSNCTYVIETSDFHVNISTLDRYLEDINCSLEIWRPINNSESQYIEKQLLCKEAKTLLGKMYGYLQLPWLAIRCLFRRLLKIKLPNIIRQGLVCCHVVTYAYKKSWIKEFKELDAESIDTEEMYLLMKKTGYFYKVLEKN